MEEQQLNWFKEILERQLEMLLVQSGHAVSELLSENSREIDDFDQVLVAADRALKLRIKSRESHLIKKIVKALKSIEDKTFGTCEICGDEIGIRRLEARPVATKCIRCKTEEERLERLAG